MNKMEKIDRTNAFQFILRLLSMSLSLAALVVMVKNSVSNDYGSLSYSTFEAFAYLVYVNGIIAVYSLLAALVEVIPRVASMSQAWIFFFLDQVCTYLVLRAVAGSTQVVYLVYEGNKVMSWSSVCDMYSVFCHKAFSSTLITIIVLVLYILLSLISSYRLFSKYEAPMIQSHGLKTTNATSRI